MSATSLSNPGLPLAIVAEACFLFGWEAFSCEFSHTGSGSLYTIVKMGTSSVVQDSIQRTRHGARNDMCIPIVTTT